ncbi:MAG: DUF2017 family protein [Acidimicrobiia bacterium]
MRRRHFKRSRKGVEAFLEAGEAAALAGVCRDLSGLFDTQTAPEERAGDPVLDRLFPRAYLDPTEEKAEAEWQRLAHGELVTGRQGALSAVVQSLARGSGGRFELSLSDTEAEAWLAVLNDARLTLGTRLEVTEDTDFSGLDPDDPDAAPYAVYWWLGLLEEELVEALSN